MTRQVKLGRKPAVGDLVLVEPGAEPSPGASKVRRLTEDDLKDGSKITLYDVVLPLPGRSIEYPSHEGGEWYRQALEKEGVDMSDPCKRMPEFSGQFSGAYRSLMMRVSSLDAKELKSDTGGKLLLLLAMTHVSGHVCHSTDRCLFCRSGEGTVGFAALL